MLNMLQLEKQEILSQVDKVLNLAFAAFYQVECI